MRAASLRFLVRAAILSSISFLFPPLLNAGFYTWKDASGTVHFTDNYYSIPDPYRSGAEKKDRQGSGGKGGLSQNTPQRVVIHFERQDNAIVVQALLNWKLPVLFNLDTGASCTMITREDAVALGLDPGSRPTVKGYIADGSVVELERVMLSSLAVGGAEVRSLEVVIGKMRLLGMDFLREFHLTIDSGRGQLVLERKDGVKEQEAPAVVKEKARTRDELENQMEQIALAIKTRRSVIEQLSSDIRESEEKRDKVESVIREARSSTRFEGSDISFDSDKQDRIEKYEDALARLNRHLEIRSNEIAMQLKQVEELEARMDYYDRLMMTLR